MSSSTSDMTGPVDCVYSPNCQDPLCPNIHNGIEPTVEELHFKCVELMKAARVAKNRVRTVETQLKALQTAIQPTMQWTPQQWTPPSAPQQWSPPPQQWIPPPQQWKPQPQTQNPKGKGKGASNRSRSCAGR